ncbi:hypothetical protein [Dongia deserti]|uniref:hypothetical protein n=1 Tax=Dongia deserti TaxID=2268030 RepID=UPI0013C4D2D0|nr:hypothetical protein [Dongia deserti]
MRSIPAKTCGVIVAPAFFYIMGLGAAVADPPVQLTQRPGETAPPAVGTGEARSCLPHDSADDKLRAEFGEKVLGRGVSSDGTLVEIFLSPTGTFTVIKTTPKGMSCVVDFGEGWQTLNQLESVGLSPNDLKELKIAPH